MPEKKKEVPLCGFCVAEPSVVDCAACGDCYCSTCDAQAHKARSKASTVEPYKLGAPWGWRLILLLWLAPPRFGVALCVGSLPVVAVAFGALFSQGVEKRYTNYTFIIIFLLPRDSC
jgi:hypothetical protein